MDNSKQLEHFGVKGMHWGVRKQRDNVGRKPKSSYAPSSKFTERKDVSTYWKGNKALQEQNLRVLKKGETVHHVTLDPELALKAGGLYVSYTEADAENYRTAYKDFLEVERNAKKIFEYEFTATQDIITPTKEKKISEFVDMYSDKKAKNLISEMGKNKVQASFSLAMGRILFGQTKSEQSKKAAEKYKQLIESKDPKDQQKAFEDFAQFLVWSPKSRKQYFDRLSKQGFTAMYDDFDMHGGYSKEPLIIFDPTKTLKVSTKTKL